MADIKIVTDSSIQLTKEEIETYNIEIIPLSVMIDDTIYEDGITLSRTEFIKLMATSKALPKTSQPAIGEFVDRFNKLGEDGSQILAIHMLEAISGTVNSARQAAQIANADVTVVDSDFTDRALAFQVIEAAKLAKKHASMEEILKRIDYVRAHTTLLMGVTSLDNLVKGGRLSRMSGLISSVLNIKVILQVKDGKLEVLSKGRGMKTIDKFVTDLVEKIKVTDNVVEIGISEADFDSEAQKIKQQFLAVKPDVPVLVAPTSPIIATHAGAGAFAVMYYTED